MDVDLTGGDDDMAVVSEGALSVPVTTDGEETQADLSDGFLDFPGEEMQDDDVVKDEEVQEQQHAEWDWRMRTEDREEDVKKSKLLCLFFFF
jgi:hypothetical protein